MICPGDPHQRNPNDPKIKGENKTAFFSSSENWCLPAPSTLRPEEREIVEDSGASMHMISKKVLHSAELETVTTSRSPTTVITEVPRLGFSPLHELSELSSYTGLPVLVRLKKD